MAFPVFDLTLAPPGKMRMPSVQGGGIEAGRALSGIVNAADMTGGGLVTVSYQSIGLGNLDPAGQRYWSMLGGVLNSRVRSIIVPLMTDFIVPGGFNATLQVAAGANAGTIIILMSGRIPSDELLVGGEWFEVACPTRLNRAHVITDIDGFNINNPAGQANFQVGISPPLREALPAGTPLNFVRPKCLMRLAPGAQITSDVEAGWWTTPDVDFVESFGST